MNFILFHKGTGNFPNHLPYCIRQIIETNPQSKVYFITDVDFPIKNLPLEVIPTTSLKVPDIGNYYIKDAYSNLWRNSVLRLFYIEALMEQNNITDVIHFDNDVLIYKNLDDIAHKFNNFDCAITSHFKNEFVFGFSFIKNAQHLNKINAKLLELVLMGENELKTFITGMPHEMRLLGYIQQQYGLIDFLPIIPEGEGSENYKSLSLCFDPSSYGQYLGGLSPERHHIIGNNILDGNVIVKFDKDSKIPKAMYRNIPFEIVNLHIHCKRLEDFVSYK